MTTNRLTIEEVGQILSKATLPITHRLGQQLLEVMRENERLHGLLRSVTQDTEYSCMPTELQTSIEEALSSKEQRQWID